MNEKYRVNRLQVARGPIVPRPRELAWPQWNSEQRAALLVVVADTLEALQRDIDGWLPRAVELQPHEEFSLILTWQFGTIDTTVYTARAHAQALQQMHVTNLQRIAGLDG